MKTIGGVNTHCFAHTQMFKIMKCDFDYWFSRVSIIVVLCVVPAWCRQILFLYIFLLLLSFSHFSKPFVSLVKQLELECTWNCFMVHQIQIERKASTLEMGKHWNCGQDKYHTLFLVIWIILLMIWKLKTKRMLRNPKQGKTLFSFSLISAPLLLIYFGFAFCCVLPLLRLLKKKTAKHRVCDLWIFGSIEKRSSSNHGIFLRIFRTRSVSLQTVATVCIPDSRRQCFKRIMISD